MFRALFMTMTIGLLGCGAAEKEGDEDIDHENESRGVRSGERMPATPDRLDTWPQERDRLWSMVDAYQTLAAPFQAASGSPNPGPSAAHRTTAVWFDAKSLIQVLAWRAPELVDTLTREVVASGVTGVRVHYAVYPDDGGPFAHRHTLVLAATERPTDASRVAADLPDSVKNKGRLSPPF